MAMRVLAGTKDISKVKPSLSSNEEFNLIPDDTQSGPVRTLRQLEIDKSKPWGFFDGSAQEVGCGGGATLHLNESHKFKLQIHLGRGTNNYAELSTAMHLIQFAIIKECRHLQLFGDSKIVCNWLSNASHCHAYTLRHILEEAKRLITSFDSFACQHIYREQNTEADQLSKAAALRQGEDWLIQEENEGSFYQYYHRPFDDQMLIGR